AVPWAGTTEQVGGSNSLFSSFNALSGTAGPVDYRASFAHRQSQGERHNGDYRLEDLDAALGWAFADHQKLTLDLQAYTVTSGLAGLMSAGQFHTDPQRTTTPDDRLWTDNDRLVLTYTNRPAEHDELTQKAWAGYTDLLTRSASYDATLSGTAATLATQRFHFAGLDGRYRHGWGHGNAVTVGYTAYDSHSPFRQLRSPDPVVSRDDESGRLLYSDQRSTRYAAVFAESLLRLPGFHVVTSGRLDYERLRSTESVATHALLVDRTEGRAVPLFGIGIGNDFGRGNETYLNVAQGYRPLRYLDIASPFSNFAPGNRPDPTRYLTYELGVHGWPLLGLYYDASLFQVTARDRIESRQLSLTETVDVNTGDTRSRGAELEASWDVLRLLPQSSPRQHLELFANASLLNAHFTASALPGQTGKVPAYAPRYVLKTGATLRVEPRVKLSLIAESVAAQYFQDSNLPIGTTPARIPGYTVADFSCDVLITPHIRLLGGISNLTDRRYYSRVFISRGLLEPALARSAYAGAAYDF
ncbi:MAG: TonB-dependent receptor, partial [Sinobacteraceae bacterium]|nr:TonB-dependent receptor [Nevskiaceae bacterium]